MRCRSIISVDKVNKPNERDFSFVGVNQPIFGRVNAGSFSRVDVKYD